ncbi:Lrp/AsnC ligand binding domain-containing protein [Candidatus Bathyarchaeota archaeon]|nr:Lrp/AsnC ligand binding domain-containing protein [Candidatus Bathyarchaeota archaeon]
MIALKNIVNSKESVFYGAFKEAHFIYGVYDIIVKVEAENMEKLKEIVTFKIRRLNDVRNTLTMTVPEGV